MATASRTHKVSPSAATPRASRSLTLSFGMFNVGVAMTTLFRQDTGIKSHMTCPEHHGRVKQAWYCEHGDHYVPREDLEATFEYGGANIVLSDGDLRSLESERDGVVHLKMSCPVEDIDPSYFEKAYLLWPTPGKPNEQAYRALLTAIRNTSTALVGQVVVSKTDRTLVIRWSAEHGTLVAHILNHGANVKRAEVKLVNEGEQAWPEPPAEYVAQAEALLGVLAGEFDPDAVEDTYQERLAEALYAKLNGGHVATQAPVVDANVPDMMAALRASIEAANPKGVQA